MFLAIVFIVLGLFLLLNAMGIIIGANFWGFFWAIVFLGLGLKMLMRKEGCPICSGHFWKGKMHGSCCGNKHEGEGHEEQK